MRYLSGCQRMKIEKKIVNIFNFITDNWKIFAGILVGGLALEAVLKSCTLSKRC